jgi:hypothetical protein
VSTETICVQFISRKSNSYLFRNWKAMRPKFLTQHQGNCRCKMAGTGIHSLAKLRPQIYVADLGNPWCCRTADNHIKSLHLRAECHRPDHPAFDPCYLRTGLCNAQRLAKGIFLLWHTGVLQRGVQEDKQV